MIQNDGKSSHSSNKAASHDYPDYIPVKISFSSNANRTYIEHHQGLYNLHTQKKRTSQLAHKASKHPDALKTLKMQSTKLKTERCGNEQ
jgi:hypothetical protein